MLSTLLLLSFISITLNQVRRGKTPECHCLGAFRSEPVSARTVSQTAILALAALFLAQWGAFTFLLVVACYSK